MTRVPQIREMREGVGALCEWKHPRAPRVALLFDDNTAARAVLAFLRNTEVGQMDTMPPSGAERVGGEYTRKKGEGEEEGEGRVSPRLRIASSFPFHGRHVYFLLFICCLLFGLCLQFLSGGKEELEYTGRGKPSSCHLGRMQLGKHK